MCRARQQSISLIVKIKIETRQWNLAAIQLTELKSCHRGVASDMCTACHLYIKYSKKQRSHISQISKTRIYADDNMYFDCQFFPQAQLIPGKATNQGYVIMFWRKRKRSFWFQLCCYNTYKSSYQLLLKSDVQKLNDTNNIFIIDLIFILFFCQIYNFQLFLLF